MRKIFTLCLIVSGLQIGAAQKQDTLILTPGAKVHIYMGFENGNSYPLTGIRVSKNGELHLLGEGGESHCIVKVLQYRWSTLTKTYTLIDVETEKFKKIIDAFIKQ